MKLGKMIGVLSAFSVVIIVLAIVMMYFTYSNQDATLRNLIAAKQKSNENHYDAMWKIIAQMAQVKDEYKADFKDVYVSIMDGRYQGEKGTLMLWIKEHNPEFDSKIYMKLMTAIEANRKEFTHNQDEILNMKKSHDDLRTMVPSKWFIPNNEIQVKVVTSTRAMEMFQSGKDDDVQLFRRPAK